MKKMRLPKPAATNVVSKHYYYGSVYTAEQMRRFAQKAVLLEREAIIQEIPGGYSVDPQWVCDMIRARGNT